MKKLIIIIDDDEKLNKLLESYLEKFGFHTLTSTNPERGLEMINDKNPELVILDVMLPGMDGFEVCRRIRKTKS